MMKVVSATGCGVKIGQAYSLAILGLCLLAGSGGAGFAANPGGKDYDSGFVDMVVPDRVLVHEVFPVTITVRNTGTRTWEGWPVRLRSVHPPNNRTWGTDYILIAQGTAVKAGDTYTFRSYLKAPAAAGKVNFQWQICKDGETWFGEVTPSRTIDVVASPATASNASVPKDSASAGKKILAFDDFEYLGSFKPPKIVQGARGAFSESGLALRPMADGRDRLLMNYTHPTQVLFEIEIPELAKIQYGEHADLKRRKSRRSGGR
jgi:hypothetical protein